MTQVRRIKKAMEDGYAWLNKLPYMYGLRSVVGMDLPDFLGIGPPKTGTTWLYENLRCHPEVYMCKEKEVHYFNHYFKRSLRFYADKFKGGDGKVKGEITPAYHGLSLKRIEFIKTILPDVKIILLVRHPVDRGWSHAAMNFVAKNRMIHEADELEVFKALEAQPLCKLGGYQGIIQRWRSVFAAEQLYIGLYDDIGKQPVKLLKEVFSHIGVSTDVDWTSFKYNEAIIPPVGLKYKEHDKKRGVIVKDYKSTRQPIPEKYKDHLMEMYRLDIEAMQKIFGERIAGWSNS